MVSAATDERVGYREGLVVLERLDGHTGRDASEQRQFDGFRRGLGRQNLDGAALVVVALDVAFALEIGEVLMHCRQRVIVEMLGDLLEARREAVLLRVSAEIG